MTSTAARALLALTAVTARWTWRLLLALLALTLAAAAALGVTAAIRHRRAVKARLVQPEPVAIETATMRLRALDPPTVEIPIVRALPAGRHAV